MFRHEWLSSGLICVGLLQFMLFRAAVNVLPDEAQVDHGQALLARLGGQPITVAEVHFHLARLPDQQNTPLSEPLTQSVVHLIAQQRQALQTLKNLGQAASSEEVEAWILANASYDGQMPTVESLVQEVCSQAAISEQQYRDFIAFRISWQRYLGKHLTQSNLAKHFLNQSARFDGTRFHIDLVSLPVPAGSSSFRSNAEAQLESFLKHAKADPGRWSDLVETITVNDPILLTDAWIYGTGNLDPGLVSALLVAEPGIISGPIHTAVAVSAIRLREIRAGQLALNDVASEVRAHMLIFLLEHLAGQSAKGLPLVSR